MKVIVIKEYIDRELSRPVKIGEEMNVSANRGKQLIDANVAKKSEVEKTPGPVVAEK